MLKDNQDAFGHALVDYFAGRATHYVVERDDGFFDAEEIAVYADGHREWSRLDRQAAMLARGRVLDLGCGAGRFSLHIQKKGHRVLAMDYSPLAIRLCKVLGVKDARAMRVSDLRAEHGPFDTIMMMGNNLGLLGTHRSAPALLRKFHRLTSEDGRIIAESLDPRLIRDPDQRRHQRRNRTRGLLPGQVRFRARYKTFVTPWFDYLFISPSDLRRLIVGTGWKVQRVMREDGPPYIAVLEKEPRAHARPSSARVH